MSVEDGNNEGLKKQILFGAGYGKPPKATRFEKGRSGNPGGRPRKAAPDLSMAEQPMLRAALKAANKKISLIDGGKAIELSGREAVTQRMMVDALKGNARAQGLVSDLFARADEANARDIRDRNELCELWKAIKTAEIEDAKLRGEPAPTILPHPDDVVADAATGPRFLGPVDKDEQRELERTLQMRETLIMQDALDHKSTSRPDGRQFTDPGAAMVMAMLLEKSIPPRLRLTDIDWIHRQFKYEAFSKRTLLKLLFTAWRQVGRPRPRGYLSLDLRVVKKWFEDFGAMYQEVQARNVDVDAIARGEFDDAALDFMQRRGLH
ncbi:DUF5681 domain-containing protein [Mesorhizobium australicum]|uniref:DUF5681 domain-containing protein n=1 Tax=Mesorhizobium australicum TaxID=536018 RepID=UPI00333A6AF9